MKCPYCGTAVTRGDTACSQCEARIAWVGEEAEFEVPESFVPVFVAYDPAMLPVVESLLSANGIPFVIPNDTTQDFMGLGRLGVGYNAITGPPVVKVPGEHAQAASELIASIAEAPPEAPAPED